MKITFGSEFMLLNEARDQQKAFQVFDSVKNTHKLERPKADWYIRTDKRTFKVPATYDIEFARGLQEAGIDLLNDIQYHPSADSLLIRK